MKKKTPSFILFCLTLLSVITLTSCSRVDNSSSGITVYTVPDVPQQVGISNNYDALTLSWGASTGASGYRILYGLDSSSELTQITVTNNATQYAFYGLQNNQDYRFMVKAYNTLGESDYSSEIVAAPQDVTPPTKPSTPFAQSIAASTTTSANGYLSWTNPTNKDFMGVIIMRNTSAFSASDSRSVGQMIYTGAAQHFTDTTIQSGIRYYYRIYAFDKVPNYSEGTAILEVIVP